MAADESPTRAPTDLDVDLDIAVVPVVSYPMVHSRFPVVSRVDLRLRAPDGGVVGRGPLTGVVVHVELRDVEGRVGSPWERVVDLWPGTTTELEDVDLQLDAATMLQLTGRRSGSVHVTVHGDGRLLAERAVRVALLAPHEWTADPAVLALELLPAYVTPQDPVVVDLVAEVGRLVPAGAGTDVLVDAVVRALARQGIGTVTVPPAAAGTGQRVRTPTEVVAEGTGSALDLTLLLAGALEALGVAPLIWVLGDGARLGYWRTDAALGPVAQVDVAEIVNLVDLELIGTVDPAVVTGAARGPGATLADALGVVDVRRARQAGVRSLPVVVVGPDGSEEVRECPTSPLLARPPDDPQAGRPAADLGRAPGPPSAVGPPPRVRRWKTALLDLSLRNRLLNFSARSAVTLTVTAGSLGAVEDALHLHEALTLTPADALDEVTRARGAATGAEVPADVLDDLFARRRVLFTDLPAATYPTRLRALAHRARTVVEETGANNLYLALGMLVWSLDGRELRSPLVLVPVRLVTYGRSGEYRVELDDAGATTPNLSLLEKLRQVHGLQIPGLALSVDDGAGIDVDTALLSVRTALAGRGLPFRVEETAHLAVLQFATFRMWKDLDDSWQELLANPLVDHLVHAPNEPFVDPVAAPDGVDLDELGAACPVPADASQLDAVAQAVAGRTFVLEGPPGTGKSQTITNMLTRAVADGLRVLFVAEKRAALDVVRSRLDAVGLGPLVLDLHGAGSRPAAVRAQLRTALEHLVEVTDQGYGADLEQLAAARGALARYAARLHEPNGAGFSFYSARTALLALGETGPGAPTLPVPLDLLSDVGGLRLLEVRRALAAVPDVADLAYPGPDNPWGFVGLTAPDRLDVAGVRRAVDEVDVALRDFIGLVGDVRPGTLADPISAARSHEDLSVLAALADAAAGDPLTGEVSLPTDLGTLDASRGDRWREAAAALIAEVDAFAAEAHPGLEALRAEALDLPVDDLHRRAREAAVSGLLGRAGRLEVVLRDLESALHPGAVVKARDVPLLTTQLLALRSRTAALAARILTVPGLRVPVGWNPLTTTGRDALRAQVEWTLRAGELVDPDGPDLRRDAFVLALRRYLDAPGAGVLAPQVADAIDRAARAGAGVAQVVRADVGQVSTWSGDVGFVSRWAATAAGRAPGEESTLALRRWVAFVAALEPLRAAGMPEARELLLAGTVAAEDTVRALDRGVASASGRERRAATGLDGFDPQAHDRAVRRFAVASDAVREHLHVAIPAEVLAARRAPHDPPVPTDRGTGPAGSSDRHDAQELGALRRELARQRGGTGVRALMTAYGDLVTRLTPCVLVSPDSLARLFPVRAGMFDLVVFDEASQIRVADAVGAMGRARAVVVVGDSKQLPPSSFAECSRDASDDPGAGDAPRDDVRAGEDDTDRWRPDAGAAGAVIDEESILSECVQARVPRLSLTWHYRSRDESLIAFSNQHYYDGRLSTFPAPPSPGRSGHGIRLVRVEGHFHRTAARGPRSLRDVVGVGGLLRTNPVEAEAVVRDVLGRFAASEDVVPSLGVVTLNAPQRALVEQLLRDAGDDRVLQALDGGADGEGLFVKNLENVQGDERDTILLSTAFSADESGRLPLNFGPLNREGGERRLNVAVTRARREVVVFSSFDPTDLHADETTSVGIRHLRGYLDLAAAGSALRAGVTPSPGSGAAGRRLLSGVDRHREQVADGLRSRGLTVRTDVGLSEFRIDLVVSFPDDPVRAVLAVLLDGPAWAARRTVADRDGLPVDVLVRSLRWPAVERVWLPAWLSTPGDVLDRLEGVARAVRADLASSATSATAPGPRSADFARSQPGRIVHRPS